MNTVDTVPLNIGRTAGGADARSYNGLIDEMFIADRALTVGELDDYRAETMAHYGL